MYYIEQFVMAYRADHDKIKKLLPEGYESLRPVLRINVEVINDIDGMEGEQVYVEFNTPVASAGMRGWLNLVTWESMWTDIFSMTDGKFTRFTADFDGTEFLDITYTRTGREGGCPHENDNDGIFFIDAATGETEFFEAEEILENKEYCDCEFRWLSPESDFFSDKPDLARQAMAIEPEEILGAYVVEFEREY